MPHLLLVEPNTILAATYKGAFTVHGYTVDTVTGAQAGIHAADSRQPDIIVLELQLPWHNGIEFLHELRSYSEWQHIPVVVHTVLTPAQTGRFAVVLCDQLGVGGILYKHNTTLVDLVAAVQAQLVAV